MLFLGRQQETERTAEKKCSNPAFLWAKALPRPAQTGGRGTDVSGAAGKRGELGGTRRRGCGRAQGGWGMLSPPVAGTPLSCPRQAFPEAGGLPALPSACPAPAGNAAAGGTGTGWGAKKKKNKSTKNQRKSAVQLLSTQGPV